MEQRRQVWDIFCKTCDEVVGSVEIEGIRQPGDPEVTERCEPIIFAHAETRHAANPGGASFVIKRRTDGATEDDTT